MDARSKSRRSTLPNREPEVRSDLAALVATIAAYQETSEMTDQQLADEIGIPRSTWTALRLGNFRPGLKFASKMLKVPRFKEAATKVLIA